VSVKTIGHVVIRGEATETRRITVRNSYGNSEHKLLMKNGAFWYVAPCGSCKNRRFAGT
jgi:hypothetical protein